MASKNEHKKKNHGKSLLSDMKFYTDYSKWMPLLERKETWEEAVKNVMDMHRDKYKSKMNPELEEAINFAEKMYIEKKVLGSQRTLQFRDGVLKHNARQYNCTVSYVDRLRFFSESFYLLLCGCGVGFSVLFKYVNQLPKLIKRDKGAKTYIIEDSIEGWANSLACLLSSYSKKPIEGFEDFQGYEVKFDYSLIRPKGAYITGGFKAPGSDGLKKSLEKIEILLNKHIQFNDTYTPIIAYDIVMHSSDAVLSGGVRRSATICIFDYDDVEMMNAKIGNWYNENPQRARSNNSALLVRSKTSEEQFKRLFQKTKEFGEPGFIFAESDEVVFNPCCITNNNFIFTEDGVSTPIDSLNKKITTIYNGEEHKSHRKGFWKTGTKKVYNLHLDNGLKLEATADHLIETTNGFKKLIDLTINDEIILVNNDKFDFKIDRDSEDFKLGYLLGNFVGDGNSSTNYAQIKFWGKDKIVYTDMCSNFLKDINFGTHHQGRREGSIEMPFSTVGSVKLLDEAIEREIFNSESRKKLLNKNSLIGSWNYVSGLINGYFDADGTVKYDIIKGSYIRLSSVELDNLEIIQSALMGFGIYSKIYKNRKMAGKKLMPNGKGGMKEYSCKTVHELHISKGSIAQFEKCIGFLNKDKAKVLNKITSNTDFYSTKWIAKLINIEEIGKKTVYDVNIPSISKFSANGISIHNCEIGFIPNSPYTEESGWSMCNLSEINGLKAKTVDEFKDACKAASILGTLQAGYTDFKYLTEATKQIVEYEALLGVSITGFMDNPTVLLDEANLNIGATIVKETNALISKLLGIRQAARTTCVKPSGNASVILGTTSGIHPEHSKRYFRVMQINKQTELAKYISENYPDLIEESVWSSNNTDYVIYVPVISESDSIFKDNLKGIKLLENVKKVQNSWVETGTNPHLGIQPYIRHNVSNTVTVDNWDEIEKYVYENKQFFAGISFLSDVGDKIYAQAPFTSVLTADEIIETYGSASMLASGLIVDGLNAFYNNLWKACEYVKSNDIQLEGTRTQILIQKDWIKRAKSFANKYFKSIDDMILCLKDVYLLHKWLNINKSLKHDIDFKEIPFKPEFTEIDTMAAMACSGGACEIRSI